MQRLMSVLLVAIAACGDSGDRGGEYFPDAAGVADAANSSDASPSQQGLELVWMDDPMLPGAVSSTVTVMTAKFHVKRLEVLGDAGSIAEATSSDFDIAWNPATTPVPLSFPFAPPAIYSKVRLNLDKGNANEPSVEIVGTTTANGSVEMFKITSSEKLDLEITGYNTRLDVGEREYIMVLVAPDQGLANVDWATLPMQNNVRTLDDTNMVARDSFLDDLETVFTAPQ